MTSDAMLQLAAPQQLWRPVMLSQFRTQCCWAYAAIRRQVWLQRLYRLLLANRLPVEELVNPGDGEVVQQEEPVPEAMLANFALELPVGPPQEMGLQCCVVGRRADLFHRYAVDARDLRDCLLEIALLWHVRTGLVPLPGPQLQRYNRCTEGCRKSCSIIFWKGTLWGNQSAGVVFREAPCSLARLVPCADKKRG